VGVGAFGDQAPHVGPVADHTGHDARDGGDGGGDLQPLVVGEEGRLLAAASTGRHQAAEKGGGHG
jgi:hypothetical protein